MAKIKKKLAQRIKDIGIPKGFSLKTIGASNSLLNSYRGCPREFLLNLNRYTNYSANRNTSFGNIMHFATGTLYEYPDWEEATEYEELIESILNKYEEMHPENCIGVDPVEFNWELNVAHIMLVKYVEYYFDDFEKKKFTEVEKELTVKVGPFKMSLKVDGKFIEIKKNWLLETKTMSRVMEKSLSMRLSIDQQNLTYITSCEKHFKEEIYGVLYNIIRKPQIRQKKSESESEYYRRLGADIEERPEFYFIRYEIPYSLQTKVEFMDELKELLAELHIKIERCKKEKHSSMFWKYSTACELPYTCSYLEACTAGKMSGYFKRDKVFTELNTVKF